MMAGCRIQEGEENKMAEKNSRTLVTVTFGDSRLLEAKKAYDQIIQQEERDAAQNSPRKIGDNGHEILQRFNALSTLTRRQLDLQEPVERHYRNFMQSKGYKPLNPEVVDEMPHDLEIPFRKSIVAQEYVRAARQEMPHYTFDVKTRT